MRSPYQVVDYSLPLYMHKDKLYKHVIVNKDTKCWEWWGADDGKDGYGRWWYDSYHSKPAHRASFEIANNLKLLSSEQVCHHCDRVWCIKPACLFQCTQMQNIHDAMTKGRHVHGETHGMHKWTQAQVDEVRRLKATRGYTYEKISDLTGVSMYSIGRIVRGEAWKG